jgi:hypothetical protein
VAVPYANLTNPQTLNLYAIVRDNPESYADLDGHCIESACILEAIAIGFLINRGIHLYADWTLTKAKADGAAAAVGFERTCALSSTCDINAVHKQTVSAVQDAVQEAAATAIKTTPQTPIPTEVPEVIGDAIVDQLKGQAVDSAKEQAQKRRELQQKQQDEQQKEEEKRRREEEEKRLRKQQKPQEVCQQGSACT